MKTTYLLKNLMLVSRNREWLVSNIPLGEKVAYYRAFLAAYARLAVKKDKRIRYFGHDFYYDNPATPFNLQNYPFEITHKILRHMKITPKHVIDIGGNIGQFPITMAAIVPDAKVDALEPNGDIYKILKKNASAYNNVKTYNVGVGASKASAKMFYEPTRSGVGSLLQENAGDKARLKEIPITLVDDVPKLTKRDHYDLVTIDVEGYEMEVVKCLSGLKTRYLFMEVSTQGRSKTYRHATLFENIKKALGNFDIVYATGYSSTSAPTFDILFEFLDDELAATKPEKRQPKPTLR
ncbi:MAG TPA: FkbM family methyltransferase [Patescibacteria group bacterium]|nr:FkbM family methyltransferase [Patescibacteria group bacterium]